MSLLERGRLVAWLPGRLRNFSRVAQLHLYSNSLRPTTAGNIMIDLYYAPTPNGHKITLFLEEAELAYRLIRVDIGKGNNFIRSFWRFRRIIKFRLSSTTCLLTAGRR